MSRLTLVVDKKFNNAVVNAGDSEIIVSSPGNFPYAGSIDTTGVPILDGVDVGNYEACFVGIADGDTGAPLVVQGGLEAGNRIVGFSFADVPGDSIKVKFYSVSGGSTLSSAVPYVWEAGLTLSIDLYYGFRQWQDQVDETAIRFLYADGVLTSGTSGGGGSGITAAQHAALRQLIHLADGVGGPFEQYASGSYREILPAASPFPTSVIWYSDATKTKKIVEKNITRDALQNAITVQWKSYDVDGFTVLATVTDNIDYSSVFELDRTRTIS